MPSRALVRVDVVVGSPAAEELALLVEGEGAAAEAARLLRGQGAGRVDERDVLRAGEAEELPQHDQPPLAGLGQGGQEGFDVVDVDQGPVVLAAVLGEEAGEVAQEGQGGFQGVVAAGRVPARRARSWARMRETSEATTAGGAAAPEANRAL
nr:hypothetical protein [Streptomyces himalayensis]